MGIIAAIGKLLGISAAVAPSVPVQLPIAPVLELVPPVYSDGESSKPAKMPKRGRQYTESRDHWVEHPGLGLVPWRLVQIFREAEIGHTSRQCSLIDDQIETDAHVRSLFIARESAVYGKPMVVQADGSDEPAKQAAQILWDACDRMSLQHGLKSLVQHHVAKSRYGFALSEIEWGVIEVEGKPWIVPLAFYNVPARRFKIDCETHEFRLLTDEHPGDGVALIPGKWIASACSATDIARSGLMRTASRNCLLKSAALTNWAGYANKYGMPLSIVYYDDDRGENVKENAEEVARNIGNDIAAAVPDKIKVEVVEAGRMGDSSPLHGGIIGYVNNENSKLIVGATLTSDTAGNTGAGSSHALGKVHENAKWSLIAADTEDIQETFYCYVSKAFIAFNGLAGVVAPPRLKIQIARDMDPTTRATVADIMLNKLGIPISVNQMRADTGYAEPADEADTAEGAPKPELPAEFGGGAGEDDDKEATPKESPSAE